MVNKIRVSAYALFLFGIVFLFMFRMNLTGNVTQDINDGEKVYHGVVSGIYLTIGVFVLLVGVFVFLYYRYNERVDRNLISFFDYLRGKAEA
ncbi:MAG: hypothetical protein PF542_00620 [Nanoarchaeota archaeon]|nr:hypothetical protein [Nanoarchaeota archaeon]